RRTRRSTLFPYTTLFRSDGGIYSYLPSPLFLTLAFVSLAVIVYYIYLFVIGFRTATHSKRVGHYVTFVLALIIADLAASYIINRSEEHTSELQSRENLVC